MWFWMLGVECWMLGFSAEFECEVRKNQSGERKSEERRAKKRKTTKNVNSLSGRDRVLMSRLALLIINHKSINRLHQRFRLLNFKKYILPFAFNL
jgi:hypothetical protein